MLNHIIWGVLYTLILAIGLGIFFYNMSSYRRFVDLTILGKFMSFILTVISVVMIVACGKFAFDNFTYSPPPRDDVMRELEEVVVTSNVSEEDYIQTISMEEYSDLNTEGLFSQYTPKGQADIRSIAKGSIFTMNLLLRNVGIDLKEDNGMTKKLQLLSGKEVDLLDGVDRLLVFADNSAFSANQLKLLRLYNEKTPIDYVVLFPTLSGTQVAEFFKSNSNDIGQLNNLQVVSKDSMRDTSNFSLLHLTQGEYKINNLPAYMFIDKYSVVSNAGVGTIFDDQKSLSAFLRHSMTDGNKLYLEIRESRALGVKKAEEKLEGVIDVSADESSTMPETSAED